MPTDAERLNVTIGSALRQCRERLRVAPAALAADMQVSLDELNDVEAGRAKLGAETMFLATQALGVPVRALFAGPTAHGCRFGSE